MRSRVRLGAHAPGARKVGGCADKDHGVAKLSRPEPKDDRQMTDTQPKQAETAGRVRGGLQAENALTWQGEPFRGPYHRRARCYGPEPLIKKHRLKSGEILITRWTVRRRYGDRPWQGRGMTVALLSEPVAQRRHRQSEGDRGRHGAGHRPEPDPAPSARHPGRRHAQRHRAREADDLAPRADVFPWGGAGLGEEDAEPGRDEAGRDRPGRHVGDHTGGAAVRAVPARGEPEADKDARDHAQRLRPYGERPEVPARARRARDGREGHTRTLTLFYAQAPSVPRGAVGCRDARGSRTSRGFVPVFRRYHDRNLRQIDPSWAAGCLSEILDLK